MIRLVGTAIVAYLGYLILTADSGNEPAGYGFWSQAELSAGLLFAGVVAVVWRRFFSHEGSLHMFNPIRWVTAAVFMAGPFFYEMAKANLDVAKRVFTRQVNPSIQKFETGMETDLGTTFLAHAITLTPGTLTLDVDERTNALYIHRLNYQEEGPAASLRLLSWIRRFTQ